MLFGVPPVAFARPMTSTKCSGQKGYPVCDPQPSKVGPGGLIDGPIKSPDTKAITIKIPLSKYFHETFPTPRLEAGRLLLASVLKARTQWRKRARHAVKRIAT